MKLNSLMAKGFSILLLTVLFSQNIFAQDVKVTVNIPPPYPIHLEDYLQFSDQAVVTLTNLSQNAHELKLLTTITGDNGIKGEVKTSWVPLSPITLNPMETKVLMGAQLKNHFSNLTEADANVTGIDINQVLRTETLPEGAYEICVRAFTVPGNTQVSDEFGCTRIFLTNYDPPVVLLPYDESNVTAFQPQMVNFTWTPAGIGGVTRYRLSIVDMTENGLFNPNDAFGPDVYVQPYFERENIVPTTFPYTVSEPPLKVGHEYAVRVTAYDPMGTLAFKNEGKSPVSTFKYKSLMIVNPPNDGINDIVNSPPNNGGGGFGQGVDLQNNPPPIIFNMGIICEEPPNFPNNTPVNGNNIIKAGDILQLGEHQLLLTEEITWNGTSLSGEGKIKNSWFKVPILVEFENLKVNSDNVVIEGMAKARGAANHPTDWLNDLSNISLGQEQINNAIAKLMGESNQRIVKWPYTDKIGIGMPVAIERNLGGTTQMIAIVGMHFGVGGAALNAFCKIDIPNQNQDLLLGASGVCFGADGFTNDAFLYLAEDYTIAPQKAVRMHLLKGDQNDPQHGTYVEMEAEGFKQLQIDGIIVLNKEKVIPVDPELDSVYTTFKIKVEDFNNFMLSNISLPEFEIVKIPGYQFSITDLTYDHSESENAVGMEWPVPNYTNLGNLWEGFYMKEISVKIPDKLNANTSFVADHIIFDDQGFTGHLFAEEVFGTGNGKMGSKDWPFSMKELDIKVVKNELISGSFNGKIRVPIQEKDTYLNYNTLVSYIGDDLKYQFKVNPEEGIVFPVIIAKANISPDTYIEVKDEGNGFEPSFHLYGDVTLNKSFNSKIQGVPFKFKGVKVQNLVVDKTGFHLGDNGAFGYASPQKEFGGFKVNTMTVQLKNNALGFGIGIDFTGEKNVIGGTGGFTLSGKWEDNLLVYKDFQVDSVSIKGDVSVVKVNGKLIFYHDDPTYGNGVEGRFEVSIQLQDGDGPGIGVETNILFGNKDGLKYFYFDGTIDPLPVGIPVSLTMNIYGFKGGVYYHMTKVGEDNQGKGIYEPDVKTKFGILAGVSLGLIEKNTFHAKVTIEANFTSKGIGQLLFDGHGYLMTKYQPGFLPYPDPPAVYIGIYAHLDFTNKIFDIGAEVALTYPTSGKTILTVNGEIQIYNAPGKWWVKIGSSPTASGPDPITINVLNIIEGHAYFMMGHELGELPPPPALVQEILEISENDKNERKSGMLNSGIGFAFGAGLDLDTGPLKYWIFYGQFAVGAGFDVMVVGNATCNEEEAGLNGWYANGGAYAYFLGEVGLIFKFCKSCKPRPIPLVDLKAAAYVEVGVPNPFWLRGRAKGSASLLGIFEGSFSFKVKHGEPCIFKPETKPVEPLVGLKFIQDIVPEDGKKKVDVFGEPQVLLTFSTNNNKSYKMTEVDKEGNENDLYYKFPLKTLTLSIDDPKSDDNGKILAIYGEDGYAGKWLVKNGGKEFTYKSDTILPSLTRLKLEVEVKVLEKDKGNWKTVPMTDPDDKKRVHETIYFTTGKEPDRLTDAMVEICMPGRNQRYYLQQDGDYVGYIETKKQFNDMFDLDNGQFASSDKIIVKLIPLDGGEALIGEYVKYENKKVFFRHPPLLRGRMYALQLIKEESPNSWIQNNPPANQGQGNGMGLNVNLSLEPTLYESMTKKQKLLGKMKLGKRQRQLYTYPFQTSKFDRLGTKVASMENGKMLKDYKPDFKYPRVVSAKIDEPFDEYDVQHLLRLNWKYEWGASSWYYGYLLPHVYEDYKVLLYLAYNNEPINEHSIVPNMVVANPVPKLTQAEIEAKLAEESLGNVGLGNLGQLNLGIGGGNPPVPPSPTIKMYFYGELMAYNTYKNYLMPKLFNVQNPVIAQCIMNLPNCQPNLKKIIVYHGYTNPDFNRIKKGTYRTLFGYVPGKINAWDLSKKYAFDWKVPITYIGGIKGN